MPPPFLPSNRRLFLKHLGLLSAGMAGGLPISSSCTANIGGVDQSPHLWTLFRNPPAQSKPFVRWWWNGDRITKEEISRELQVMKEAGIGGVEINPVAMPEQVNSPSGTPLVWLSDEWIEILKYTLHDARDKGMVVDLIVGTGWPFGAEFLQPDETIQGVKSIITKVKGPIKTTIPLPTGDDPASFRIIRVVLYPEKPSSLSQVVDLTSQIHEGQNSLQVDIPAGAFSIAVVTWQNHFRSVLLGAPGGAGPVLDHFNKKAVEKYLNHMSEKINKGLGDQLGNHIRAMFCDSIELEGANWTGDFEAEFQKRRGYEISPYLPLLLDKSLVVEDSLADELNRVRYDQSRTLAELFLERFIVTYHQWCHDNGAESRYQAYGFPWLYTDLIDGYLIPDIPEGDQWLFNNGWQPYCDVNRIRYAIWDKYASSAGHIAGRKIISAEAMTNTTGVFEATLGYIKQASDLNIATGVNHHVLHGFNYSPPEAGFPGWIRFGCYFNEKNTWWPYFHKWTNYISKLSAIMQASTPVCQVALMGPTPDIWSEAGLDRNPFNLKPWYLHCLWQALNHNGYCSDYVNGNVLKGATVTDGQIHCGSMQYDALMLCEVGTVPAGVADAILALVDKGAKVITVGEKPHRSPGLKEAAQNDNRVQESMESAMRLGMKAIAAPGEDLQDSQQELTHWVRRAMQDLDIEPGIRISNPDYRLYHQQLASGNQRIYFFSNVDETRELAFRVTLPDDVHNLSGWDPETDVRQIVPLNESVADILLRPLESILLVSGDEGGNNNTYVNPKTERRLPVDVNGQWEISCLPFKGDVFQMKQDALTDLSQYERTAGFSGELVYRNHVSVDADIPDYLDLGDVFDIASLQVNGKEAGIRWYGEKIFRVKDLLLPGSNELTIKVTNTLFNYVRTLNDPVSEFWMSRTQTRKPMPAGLVGPLNWIYS